MTKHILAHAATWWHKLAADLSLQAPMPISIED